MKFIIFFCIILGCTHYGYAQNRIQKSSLNSQQESSLRKYIKERELNLCYDDQAHEPVGKLKLKSLGHSCNGRPIYLLDVADLKYKVDGTITDCAGYHEGSAGGPTPILAWDKKQKKFHELFWGPVRKAPSVSIGSDKDCPELAAEVHPIHYEKLDASAHVSVLRFNKSKDRYRIEIVRLKDGISIRTIEE